MHILIVDDEIVSRTKMETLMRSFGTCEMAENGRQAIDMFADAMSAGNPFEVITLDINMPDMQGTDVLKQIRSIERRDASGIQHAAIIMVTSQSDQDLVLCCLQAGCDDYIAKPFNIQIICRKLQRLGFDTDGAVRNNTKSGSCKINKAEKIFQDINRALRAGSLSLPVLPDISLKFRDLIQNNADMDQMAALLKQDMVIASKLIRVANSAMYKGYGAVRTIEQAISRLGLSLTQQMVEAIANQQLYAVGNPKYRPVLGRLWRHSLSCAFAADTLQQTLERDLRFDAFTAGLFHDIGALALIQIIAEMDKRGRFPEGITEQGLIETVGAYHAMFGAKLLEKWEFEMDYVRTALYHNALNTAEAVNDELLIVHLANQMSKALGYATFQETESIDLPGAASTQALKLSAEQLDELKQAVADRIAGVADLAGN